MNTDIDYCLCHLGQTVSGIYIFINCSLNFAMGLLTVICYLCIYSFVHRKVGVLNSYTKDQKYKLKVLRTQTAIFFLLFILTMPYIILTFILSCVEQSYSLSVIKNYTGFILLIDFLTRPFIYTYRLKFMRKLFYKDKK